MTFHLAKILDDFTCMHDACITLREFIFEGNVSRHALDHSKKPPYVAILVRNFTYTKLK